MRRRSERLKQLPQTMHISTPDSADTTLAKRSSIVNGAEKPLLTNGPKKRSLRPPNTQVLGNSEIDQSRLVRFRYIQRQDARLGYTTREISVEFSDDDETKESNGQRIVKIGRKKRGKIQSRKASTRSKKKTVDVPVNNSTITNEDDTVKTWVGEI